MWKEQILSGIGKIWIKKSGKTEDFYQEKR